MTGHLGYEKHDPAGRAAGTAATAPTGKTVLIEEPGRAVIAAGFLRTEDRFGRWLKQFVARSP